MSSDEGDSSPLVLSPDSSTREIIGTGILLGIVHVVTGPDHMAAIATLSAGNSWRAFRLGCQWGVGHSIGLVLTGLLFLNDVVPLDRFGKIGEPLVGVFMILLGFYSYYDATVEKKISTRLAESGVYGACGACCHDHVDVEQPQDMTPVVKTVDPPAEVKEQQAPVPEEEVPLEQGETPSEHVADHEEIATEVTEKPKKFSLFTRLISLFMGIIHGAAGPGGVLGIVPAILLDDRKKSFLYLGCFCLTSIVVMGIVAALYGEITLRLGTVSKFCCCGREGACTQKGIIKGIKYASATLSLIIGILWLSLSFTGKLDEIFP